MGMKSNGGDNILNFNGGNILRSTAKKDRHSKILTSKGPKDRRVRLSAHTAIQFYDVQDRLGYDRPSKAVDWLINKAKSAIDKLNQLPPQENHSQSPGYNPASTINFQSYPQDIIISTNPNPTQDLGLSLQSFQNSPLNTSHISSTDQTQFLNSAPVGFVSNFQRSMVGWSSTSPLPASQREIFGQGLTSFPQSGDDMPIGSAIVGTRYVSDGLPAFHFPFLIHGEEESGGVSDTPSSSPPDSNH